jgi:hypothetical protein
MGDGLAVRITTVGHASRRWSSARNAAEADILNLQLSELRAQNVRKAVEDIIKRELPALAIDIPAKGVGSREPFPTASEDNAAVDRGVLVMVDLTTTAMNEKRQHHPPQRIYSPSKLWTLTVLSMVGGGGLGYKGTFLRVSLRNEITGKKISLSGGVHGGDLGAPVAKNLFKFDADKVNLKKIGKPIGDTVTFSTDEALDFDFWTRDSKMVRLVHSHVKTGVTKSEATFIQFTDIDTSPGSLVFELKTLGFKIGWPDVDVYVATGFLSAEESNPGDYLVYQPPDDYVPTQTSRDNVGGMFLSFPTGKANLSDLTVRDRESLTKFVTDKARNIAALSSFYNVSAPRP